MHRLLTGLLVSFFSVVFLPSLGLAQSGQATALLAPEECGRIPQSVLRAWPLTDFTKCTAPIEEVRSGGPGKDGIRSIENPNFQPVSESELADREPVITVSINGDTRTYPAWQGWYSRADRV